MAIARRTAGDWRRPVVSLLIALACLTARVAAQDRSPRIEVVPDSVLKTPRVQTFNLLEDTPWLTALRQGLPVQLRYKVELWRSREGWFDAVTSSYEWRVTIINQPLLDQFAVYIQFPGRPVRSSVYATPNVLAAALRSVYAINLRPAEAGSYYFAASVDVRTLSDSDLDDFNKVVRGEITSSGGGSLAERARRLALQLAGLPKDNLSGRSSQFEVKK